MKRGTIDHPKMTELALALGVRKYAAAGILESLWAFAARYTPQGNVGKYSDAAIAKAIDYEGDPASLMLALASSGWIDQIKEGEHAGEYTIHDWKDHCDQTTDRYLSKNELPYLLGNARQKLAKTSLPVSVSVSVSVPSTATTEQPPTATEVPPPTTEVPPPKPPLKSPYADAFKLAFDSQFPEPYSWQAGDFAHLAKWRKAYPSVSVERFVEVARELWDRQFRPPASLAIRGLCAGWAPLVASLPGTSKPVTPKALPGPLRSIYGEDEGQGLS